MPKGFPLVVSEAGDCALRKHDRQPTLRACPPGSARPLPLLAQKTTKSTALPALTQAVHNCACCRLFYYFTVNSSKKGDNLLSSRARPLLISSLAYTSLRRLSILISIC